MGRSALAHGEVSVAIGGLPGGAWALVLGRIPNVLTVGRRCMGEGFCFRWDAGKLPELIAPRGKSVECEVEDFVPVLRPGRFALPAVDDTADEPLAAADPVPDAAVIPATDEAHLLTARSCQRKRGAT